MIKKQEALFASTQRKDLDEYQNKIQEYRNLLNKSTQEDDFQSFFEQNPVFLDPRVKTATPKKSLGGEFYPDLVFELHDSSYLLIEIERPNIRLFNNKGDPTSALTHAQQQIRKYLQWIIEEIEFLKKRGCAEISADSTKGLVIIGKSVNLGNNGLRTLGNINAEVRNRYEIKTFDKILEENEAILRNLRSK